MRGVSVDASAVIDPGARIEPSGGRIAIGARSFIDYGVIVRPLEGFVEIGEDCSVNAYSVLYGGGGLKIGNGVRIAAHTVIVPSNHKFADAGRPIREQGLSLEGIVIEDDVWIGAGVKILDGVTLGKGSVIGAGAVVTRSVAPNAVVGGVPARPIASR
jgi:acetyltransferase-like isoleucine patch superfamily enzyme